MSLYNFVAIAIIDMYMCSMSCSVGHIITKKIVHFLHSELTTSMELFIVIEKKKRYYPELFLVVLMNDNR